jgi:hypothetical protein
MALPSEADVWSGVRLKALRIRKMSATTVQIKPSRAAAASDNSSITTATDCGLVENLGTSTFFLKRGQQALR